MGLLTMLIGKGDRRLITRIKTAARGVAISTGLCLALSPAPAVAAEGAALENVVKAAYLSKFGFYVEWPKAALASPSIALNLCVAGEDPFGTVLDKAVAAQQGGRPIAVRRLKSVGANSGCHVLYVGAAEPSRAAQWIATVRGDGVLTVSDVRGAGEVGAIINFVVKDNRVRFDIDEGAALQNGLTISSKLMSLAVGVKRKKPEESR